MKDITQNMVKSLLSDRKLTQLVIVAVIVFAAFSILVPELFLTSRNFVSMAFQIPEIALLALGVMLAMLTAGIDLSVVSMSNLAALSTAYLLVTQVTEGDGNVYVWIVITLLIGIFVGLVAGLANGLIIAGIGGHTHSCDLGHVDPLQRHRRGGPEWSVDHWSPGRVCCHW